MILQIFSLSWTLWIVWFTLNRHTVSCGWWKGHFKYFMIAWTFLFSGRVLEDDFMTLTLDSSHTNDADGMQLTKWQNCLFYAKKLNVLRLPLFKVNVAILDSVSCQKYKLHIIIHSTQIKTVCGISPQSGAGLWFMTMKFNIESIKIWNMKWMCLRRESRSAECVPTIIIKSQFGNRHIYLFRMWNAHLRAIRTTQHVS